MKEYACSELTTAAGDRPRVVTSPPVPVALVSQPPSLATQRPPDNVTADWCGNLTIQSDGTVKNFLIRRRDGYSLKTFGESGGDRSIAGGQPDGVGCTA